MCNEKLNSTEPIELIDEQFTQKEVNKGLKVLNSELLTDAGRRWLTRALDPFHDSQVEPAGYPDLETAAVVLQEVNLSTTISVPSGVASGATWDVHIFNGKDFAQPRNTPGFAMSQYGPQSATLSAGTPGTVFATGLATVSGPAGVNLLPGMGPGTVGMTETNQINPVQYLNGKSRIVGMGFEVTNVTSDLYKQGTVTCYRMPQLENVIMMVNSPVSSPGSTGDRYLLPYKTYALPPANVSEALLLPGSKQWDARRGAYLVVTQTGLNNDFASCDNVQRLYLERSEGYLDASMTQPSLGALNSYNTSYSVNGGFTVSNAWEGHHNTSGAYFTGLSYETVLQVNVKFLIESAPGPRSPFATICKPAPQYDPEAIRLYSELSQTLPVACPVDMNPSGEWFRMILGTVGDLSTMASGINPLFGLLGQGLKVAGNYAPQVYDIVKNAMDKEKKKAKKVERPNSVQTGTRHPAKGSGNAPRTKMQPKVIGKSKR